MKSALLVAVTMFLAGLLGGCVGSPDSAADIARREALRGGSRALEVAPDWHQSALPFGEGHDHKNRSQHAGRSTPNFEILGYEPLITDYHGRTSTDYLCGAAVEKEGRRLSVVNSMDTDVAFVISDVTDPAWPRKLSELVMDKTQVYDVTITPDLRYVVMGTSVFDYGPDAESQPLDAPRAWFRDACTGEERPVQGPEQGLPFGAGVVLVDIRNPRNPIIQDFRFYPPLGAHSVRAHDLNGRSIVMATVLNLVHEISYYVFMEVQETPAGGRLVPLYVHDSVQRDGTVYGRADPAGGGHDGFIAKHPVTGDWLAYLADGPNGLVILDIDDLRSPRVVSHWKDWGVLHATAPPNPYIHSVLPAPETWDGRHYTFLGEECLQRRAATPSCLIFVLDTTDPAKPSFVGAWTLPVDVTWQVPLDFSLHYIALLDRTLLVTAYHGGLWALDVSTAEALRTLPAIGVLLPTLESPKPGHGDPPRSLVSTTARPPYEYRKNQPVVLDLDVMADGTIVLFEINSGLYTTRFDPTRPAPPPEPWPLAYDTTSR